MRRLYVTFAVVFWFWASPTWATCTGSSPTWTSTPDLTSVSSCVSSASRGDTINVSAGDGTETWTSALSVTKGVSLIGPGRNSLSISGGGLLIIIAPDATAITNNELIRVSGFTFKGNDTAVNLIRVVGAGSASPVPFRKLVIETNRFRDMLPVDGGSGVIYTTGQVRGVIADNIFDRANVILKIMGNNLITDWENGNFSFAFGSGDNLYFEDNLIQWSTATANSGTPGWTESGQGGRLAMRYNIWNYSGSAKQSETWDMHGFQNFTGPPLWPDDLAGQTGTMITEYYGNTLTSKAGYRWVAFRGSWGLLFNNIVTGTSGSAMAIMQYDRGCNSYVKETRPPPNGEINNTYGFNNTMNGSAVNFALWSASGTPGVGAALNNTCPPVENIGFWNYNAACTSSACAAGIGRGTTPPTGTCTTGVGYWVASTATPTTDSTVIQNGALYKCTSTNAWKLYYKPYIYPHPLRSGTNESLPQAPTGLSIF